MPIEPQMLKLWDKSYYRMPRVLLLCVVSWLHYMAYSVSPNLPHLRLIPRYSTVWVDPALVSTGNDQLLRYAPKYNASE